MNTVYRFTEPNSKIDLDNMNSRFVRRLNQQIALSPASEGMESSFIHALLCATDYGILMADTDGNDILCNPQFGEIFDVDPEVIVRSTREDVRELALSRVKNPTKFLALMERVNSDPTLYCEDEVELSTDIPRIISRFTAPVYDNDGRQLGRVWTFKDITETKRLQGEVIYYANELERQLERQVTDLEQTRKTLKTMTAITAALASSSSSTELCLSIASILTDMTGCTASIVILGNDNHAIGAKCLIRENPLNLTSLETHQFLNHIANRVVGSESDLVVRKINYNGTSLGMFGIAFEESVPQPHENAVSDHIALALELYHLYSELQVAYDHLRLTQNNLVHSEKVGAVGKLAASIAHDIRNIMTPLSIELSFAEQSEFIISAKSQVDRLSALTHRLLSLTKPSEVVTTPVSLEEIIEHILPLIRPQANVDNVIVRTHFEENLPPIQADAARLEHLFINLFLNAISSMSQNGGTLSLTATKGDEFVEICVEDTGHGIAEKELPHLFDAFFTTRANGSGLGLFSVKTIIEEHLGRIEVTSVLEKGTRFTIYLPCAVIVGQTQV